MIMFAIMIVVLIGFVGLVIDAGILYVTKASLQNSVDAAALAGAQGLPSNDPIAIACTSIDANPVSNMTGAQCGGKADVVTSPASLPNTITVTSHRSVPTTLMKLLGNVLPTNVEAHATVRIMSAGGKTCFFPLFIIDTQFAAKGPLYTPIGFTDHNTAVLEAGASGGSDVTAAMGDDCLTTKSFEASPGDNLNVKTGSANQWRSGWDALLLKAKAPSSACQSSNLLDYVLKDVYGNDFLNPALTLENCPRLLMVPVAKDLGNGQAKVLGFTPFFFSDICDQTSCSNPVPLTKHDAWGYYLNMEFASGGTVTDYNSFGTKVIVMTE